MRLLPSNNQEWVTAILRPFKAYAIIAPAWLLYSVYESFSIREAQVSVNGVIFLGYMFCIPVFVLASLIQILGRQQRSSIVSLIFALAILVSILFFMPALALARK